MHNHLGVQSWIVGKGAIAGGDGVRVPTQKVVRCAEPCSGKTVGSIKAKRAFEPRERLAGSTCPHQDRSAIGEILRVTRIDLQRAIDLRKRKFVTLPVELD